MRGVSVSAAVLAATVAGAAWLASVERADACGAFFRPHRTPAEPVAPKPSLAREEVLIVHDPTTRQQHFVRRVAFEAGGQVFGFVVPTPSRAEVAPVELDPFQELRRSFPFSSPMVGFGHGLGAGPGGGKPAGARGVEVLETKRVGSFTAFVLAASDASALSTWLKAQGFESTPETAAWARHYVDLGFHYVALRYEPPKDTKSGGVRVKAETLRISFSTPLPYYPYQEPQLESGEERADDRLVELWLVSPQEHVPVATVETDAGVEWVRPFREGLDPDLSVGLGHADPVGRTRRALGAELEPLMKTAGFDAAVDGYPVQVFQDQKRRRPGFGDVVFVPRKGGLPQGAELDALRSLLRLLDPGLAAAASSEDDE